MYSSSLSRVPLISRAVAEQVAEVWGLTLFVCEGAEPPRNKCRQFAFNGIHIVWLGGPTKKHILNFSIISEHWKQFKEKQLNTSLTLTD